MQSHAIPRLVIAAPHSHAGKTTITLALLAALTQRGLRVAPFKVGPDYIDPQMHRQVVGRPSYNLDTYLVPGTQVRETFCRVAQEADIAIIEGVMGLFDGSSPTSKVGSSAEVATLVQAPIVLVIDAAGMAASVGALVHGFRTYDPEVHVAGVILNRLGSAGHARYLAPAIAREGVELLGCIPKDAALHIPERHLGLLPTSEEDRVTPLLGRLAALATEHLDLDRLLALAQSAPPMPEPRPVATTTPRVRIAWAQDAAFHFWYQENIDALTAAGAEIVRFSPLNDAALPPDVDGVWIGGGFPEHFAPHLAANTGMIAALRAHVAAQKPLYAECGGLMYLCEWLEDQHGQRTPQVGLIPGGTRMTERLQQFGYAEATFLQPTLFGPAQTTVRGHRFHYSVYEPGPTSLPCAYRITRPSTGDTSLEGFTRDQMLATYLHVHLGSQPGMAQHFVAACHASRALHTGLTLA